MMILRSSLATMIAVTLDGVMPVLSLSSITILRGAALNIFMAILLTKAVLQTMLFAVLASHSIGAVLAGAEAFVAGAPARRAWTAHG